MSIRVLLAEDDPDYGEGLQQALELEGLEVDLVVTGEEASAKLRRHAYDLLLADVKLPGKSGLDIYCDQIERGCWQDTVFISAFRLGQVAASILGHDRTRIFDRCGDMESVRSVVETSSLTLVSATRAEVDALLRAIAASKGDAVRIIRQAERVAEALPAATAELVCLDTGLPLLHSFALYARAARSGALSPTLIVAESTGDWKDHSMWSSYADTGGVFKPFDPIALIDLVRRLKSGASDAV